MKAMVGGGLMLVALVAIWMHYKTGATGFVPKRAISPNVSIPPQRPPHPPTLTQGNEVSGQAPNYAQEISRSHSYYDFVRSAGEAAKSGDVNAQYYVGKALSFCDDTYRTSFQDKGQRLTVDEALQRAAKWHRSNTFTQLIYDRCRDLEDHAREFGRATDWIAKAASEGQPAAQATLAELALSQALRSKYAPSNPGGHLPDRPGAAVDPGTDPHALLREAVQSKDPEVLWLMGAVEDLLRPGDRQSSTDRLAWWLVSCQRGYDCGPGADWIQYQCPVQDMCAPGMSGLDYIRFAANEDWPDVQRRANEISASLDAGQWDELVRY